MTTEPVHSVVPTMKAPVTIDANGKATLPKLGLGAWAWGDALFWGYRPSEDEELQKVFEYATERGVGFFDTAELCELIPYPPPKHPPPPGARAAIHICAC